MTNNSTEHSKQPDTPKPKKQPRTNWNYPNIQAPAQFNIKLPAYHQRRSFLDYQISESKLNKSQLRGFFSLAIVFGTFFLFIRLILNYIDFGYLYMPGLYNTFQNDLIACLLIWPIFYFWCFTSFFIQKCILLGLSEKVATVLQHLSQTGMFIFSSSRIISREWCVSHTIFVTFQTCVHFMKMHSYSTTNRDYRAESTQAKLNNRKPLTNYPNNVTFTNFAEFLWTPVLTYCESYPRLKTRNIWYIIQKSVIAILTIFAVYIVHTEYNMPNIANCDKMGYVQLVIRCSLPMTVLFIMIFFVVFENILNVFGQLTKFADRQFYDDWWNSSTFKEFNRMWNKPVHHFLYRHVYLECIVKYKTSKKTAQMVTFLFSAVLHQLVLSLIFKTIRPIILGFMIGQVPLFYITDWLKGTIYGNYFFWSGMTIGPSLIICGYLKTDEKVAIMI